MRAYQFIFEYRRDKTGQAVGDKLLSVLQKTSPAYLPDSLTGANTLLSMAAFPKKYPPKKIILDILGQNVTLDPTNPDELNQLIAALKSKIIDATLQEIEAHDPTRNKQYTQWLARMWSNGGVKLEDLNRLNYIGQYHQAKEKNLVPTDRGDINRFKTYGDFEEWFHTSGISEKLKDSETEKKMDQGSAKKVYEDGDVTVIIPEDEAAACRYGRGTRWCTAATQGNNLFSKYSKEGNLYILLPKKQKHPGEKYQLHFETAQFMDENDDQVDIRTLLTVRFPKLYSFFEKQIPDYFNGKIIWASDETLSKFSKLCGKAITKIGSNFYNSIDDKGYDTESFKQIIKELKYVSPENLMSTVKSMEDMTGEHPIESWSFEILPAVYETIIRNEYPDDADTDFSTYVSSALTVSNKSPEDDIEPVGTVDGWTVGIRPVEPW